MAKVGKGLNAMRHRLASMAEPGDGQAGDERLDALRKRVAGLEREVQETRELHRRVAELTDVVTELLVPIADRDTDKVNAVLDKYRTEL